jgi:ADP-L-glycero-D-manno-heptose 6-epimerase
MFLSNLENYEMIIVTGGAGFIGSNIIAGLEAKGYNEIVVVDRMRNQEKWKNVAKRDLHNIVHPDNLFEYLNSHQGSIDAVIHMGAISSTMETDADKIIENNFRTSLGLWKWCTRNQKRFIYASSAATYGDGSNGFDDGESRDHLSKLQPLNAYGWSKHQFDRRIAYNLTRDVVKPIQWAGLKFFNVYGPNEYHKGNQKSVVAHIYPTAKKDEQFNLFKSHRPDYKDGEQKRDFVWVGDIVDIVLWLLENDDVSGLFNVGTGKARTFYDLAENVYKALGNEPKLGFVDTPIQIRDKYQYFTEANMRKIREAGYTKPMTSLEDGVRKYVQEYLDKEDAYK